MSDLQQLYRSNNICRIGASGWMLRARQWTFLWRKISELLDYSVSSKRQELGQYVINNFNVTPIAINRSRSSVSTSIDSLSVSASEKLSQSNCLPNSMEQGVCHGSVRRWPLTAGAQIRSQALLLRICGSESGCSPKTAVFLWASMHQCLVLTLIDSVVV